ncbi:MAG: sigma-70 family RNA polymerase sigma factor [Myxococcota bacterium]
MDAAIVDQILALGRKEASAIEVDERAWRTRAGQWLTLAHARSQPSPPASRWLETFVVLAATAGSETASAWLTSRYLEAVRDGLRAARVAGEDGDDAVQQMWLRLFAAHDDEPPPVLRYVGHGDLGKLLKVSALRIALNQTRDQARWVSEAEAATVSDDLDIEAAAIRGRYQAEFKAAFEAAVARLAVEDRVLLRMHILDGLSIDQLGALHGIHRSTAARRISRARETVASGVRDELTALVGPQAPVQSLLRLARSQLELSLSRVLGDPS